MILQIGISVAILAVSGFCYKSDKMNLPTIIICINVVALIIIVPLVCLISTVVGAVCANNHGICTFQVVIKMKLVIHC